MTLRFDWSSFVFQYPPDSGRGLYKDGRSQLSILDDTWDRVYHALFMWPRTGKSKLTIDTLMANTLAGNVAGAIIIAKSGEYQNWSAVEIPKHWNPAIPRYVATWKSAMSYAQERDLRARLMDGEAEFKILVINVESLRFRKERGKPVKSRGLQLAYDLIEYLGQLGTFLVVDESTCVKHHESGQSKAVYFLRKWCKMRRILTGTPITESPLHIWGQSLALADGLLGHSNYTSFRAYFAKMEKTYLPGGGAIDTVQGYRNLGELQALIDRWSTSVGEDALNLTAPTRQIIAVPMDDKQRKYYQVLVDTAVLELEERAGEEPITVANKLSLMGKLHQIVCGHIKVDAESTVKFSEVRADALLAFLEPRPHKCLIYANYRASVEGAHDALVKEYGQAAVAKIYGGTQGRMEIVARFQDPNDPLRFIVGNQQSMGYGLTLDQARTIIYYANEWSGERRIQSEQRANNPANNWAVELVDFITPGTVDQRYYQVLTGKSELLHDFFTGQLSLHDLLMPDEEELIGLERAMSERTLGGIPKDLLALISQDLGEQPQS